MIEIGVFGFIRDRVFVSLVIAVVVVIRDIENAELF